MTLLVNPIFMIEVRSWKVPARRQDGCTRARFEADIASVVDLVQAETATRLGATVTCSLAFQRRTLPLEFTTLVRFTVLRTGKAFGGNSKVAISSQPVSSSSSSATE